MKIEHSGPAAAGRRRACDPVPGGGGSAQGDPGAASEPGRGAVGGVRVKIWLTKCRIYEPDRVGEVLSLVRIAVLSFRAVK